MTNLNDIATWFQAAEPGWRIVYHTGNLAFDCHIAPSMPDAMVEKRRSMRAAARFLMNRCEAREVHLVQRRVSKDVCDYIAVRTANTDSTA